MHPAGRVFQQLRTAALGKAARPAEEVTVAAHHIEVGLAGELLHGREHGLQECRIIIITHPVFEQVTQMNRLSICPAIAARCLQTAE
jgi:hypothetical protein